MNNLYDKIKEINTKIDQVDDKHVEMDKKVNRKILKNREEIAKID